MCLPCVHRTRLLLIALVDEQEGPLILCCASMDQIARKPPRLSRAKSSAATPSQEMSVEALPSPRRGSGDAQSADRACAMIGARGRTGLLNPSAAWPDSRPPNSRNLRFEPRSARLVRRSALRCSLCVSIYRPHAHLCAFIGLSGVPPFVGCGERA